MSLKSEHPPLTWARVLELAAQGHDHYDAALTSTRARQLVASVREHFAGQCEVIEDQEQLRGALVATNATLARVLALIPPHYYEGTMIYATSLVKALASQPEAPKGSLFESVAVRVSQLKGQTNG